MDCGLYGFLSLRFLEKESAKTAAARNPKGDKSGRGLASLRAAAGALLVNVFGCTPEPGSELWLSNTAIGRAGDLRQGRRPCGRGLCVGAYWGLLGLKTA